MAQILCFGDSITYGMWDSQGGWVMRLRKSIDRQIVKSKFLEWHEVFNLGVSGNLTEDLIKRLDSEIKSRLLIETEAVVVIAIGINDTKFGERKTLSKPERYVKQLDQIHKIVNSYTKRLLYVGLTPVNENIYGPKRWNDQKEAFSNGRIQEFDLTLRRFCLDNHLPVVDIFSEFIKRDYLKLLADGIHLNDAGHALVASLVKPAVLDLFESPVDELGSR